MAARAYYNEIDPIAAETLRELIRARVIAPGDVDERSIEEVSARDLARYSQCHFFAGFGVWSGALRAAGWPDDARVWTGSCPCPSFSQSGKRLGFDDPRHLWPAWSRIIRESRPDLVFGEQVADPAGLAWFDLVCADLEGSGYAVGQADTCAASVGAPHIRQRLYFVAESQRGRREQWNARERLVSQPYEGSAPSRLVNTERTRLQGLAGDVGGESRRSRANRPVAETGASARTVADSDVSEQGRRQFGLHAQGRNGDGRARAQERAEGFWDDAVWIKCRDGKLRPIPAEPALFPLAPRTAGRVGVLRGAGNALCLPQAVAFIEAYLDVAGAR